MSELLGSAAPASDQEHGSARPARRDRDRALAAAGAPATAVLIALGAAAGWWMAPFVTGLAAGVLYRRRPAWLALGTAALGAAAGWTVPLLWLALHGEPIMATASVVAVIAGLPPSGALILCATVLIAVVQAVLGVWLARVLRGKRDTARS